MDDDQEEVIEVRALSGFKAPILAQNDHMSRRRDGKPFCDAFDDAEDDGLKDFDECFHLLFEVGAS